MMKLRCHSEGVEESVLPFGRPFALLRVTMVCLFVALGCWSPCARAETPREGTRPTTARITVGDPSHPYPVGSIAVGMTNTPPGLVTEVHESNAMLRVSLADGEALWGLGERFDSLNIRGRTMETWIADAWGGGNRSYICAPFLISSAGYGLFFNCTGKVKFDCGATSTNELRIEVPEGGLDVFVFHGTPREILAEYTKLVGRPELVPDWVFEPWISRNSYLSEYDVDRVIDRMETNGLKAGAVVLEAWAESLQNFRFDQGRYPKPREWIEKLHQRGYHVVCWETPSLWDSASIYAQARTNNFLVRNADGSELRVDWLENAVKMDFRNADARDWWKRLQEPLIAMGVDGFKTDGGERMPDPWFHNLHPYYYQRAVLDAFQAEGKLGMTFARSGTAPCAGNSTFWGGDESSSWNDFPRVVRAGLSAALSGFPYWGHDIGGYSGTPPKNLYIRWLELGAFSPIMQLHGTTPREPWYYDDETMRIAKYYFDLRWALQDYLLAAAKRAREDGVPMWRPLLYVFPDDPATYNIDDEFVLGDDLLVAPVLTEFGERTVYLPRGEWVNVWTKEKVTGPKTFTVRPKLAEIPVFARADQAARFDKMLPPLPSDQHGDVFMELGGEASERGVVPTRRLIRGEKYEKVFITVHNRGAAETNGEVRLSLSNGFTALPSATQPFRVEAHGEARLAFYAIPPKDLTEGTYPAAINLISHETMATPKAFGVVLQFIKEPTHWQVIGPFDGGVGAEFSGDLPTDFKTEYLGAGGRKARWQTVGNDCVLDDGFVDFAKALGKDNNGATTFAATMITSRAGGSVRLYVGSGDALTIWLNGEQVFDKQVHRSAEPDEDAVDVKLRPGENSVLVKISRGIGLNGIYFRVAGGSS
jgi:alpha-D-xyloside xylohydrolase